MLRTPGLSDTPAPAGLDPEKCPRCGASARLGGGLCAHCLLDESTVKGGEASYEEFVRGLREDDVPDTAWQLGNYEILGEIGRGSMGIIYRARQRHSKRVVAVKRVLSYRADSNEWLERFRRETEAAASLDHPNILPIYEVSESEDGVPYYSMKWALGGSLRNAGPALAANPRECVRLIAKVARALEYAHKQGVLHRDLQPGNILLDGWGEPLVCDFGLAKWLDGRSDLTQTLTTFGTPGYIAPEQAEGPADDLHPTADIYSLGAVLFNLLAKRPPFLGANALSVIHQAAANEAPKLRDTVPSLDRDLETVLAHCLEREPEARYQTAGELADDLESWLEHRPIEARAPGLPTKLWRRARRNSLAAVLTLGLAVAAGGLLVLQFLGPKSGMVLPSKTAPLPGSGMTAPAISSKSIAVLPFENMSDDAQNAYFSSGIQDEILTRLGKIADLKVISRLSTQQYQSKPGNLSEIARHLGVANVLEGSVQKAGDRVHVNVQLIQATTDSLLWSETYDRTLIDIFSVETEVAKAIAEQLRAKLTGAEEQVIAAKPTDNPEAHDAYLRGLAHILRTGNSPADYLGAQRYLREAVRLDAKFALGWALLSFIDSRGYITRALQPTVALREEAREAAETALALQPNLGEALLAKGFYHYACLKDYDVALRYLEQAHQLLPNSSRIPESLAYIWRRRGEWERSEAYFNEADRLDPRNVYPHAFSYILQRRFPEALRKFDQILNLTPDDLDTLAVKAAITQAQGDLPRAAALLAPLRPAAEHSGALETQVYQAILERRPAPAILRLKAILAQPDPALGYINGELRFWLGWAQEVAGDHAAARETWQQAQGELEPFLNQQPENQNLLEDLALIKMGLGDKDAAFHLIERAQVAVPMEKDRIDGPQPLDILARVAAGMGEPDRAIAALEKILAIPYEGPLAVNVPLTSALLRLDPMFDPLRKDPRFQKLCEDRRQ